jgi:hypothetical protein
MSHLVLGLGYSDRNRCVDQIDGNTLNCCRSNLVVKTASCMLYDAQRANDVPVPGIWLRRGVGWVSTYIHVDSTTGARRRRYRTFKLKYNLPSVAYVMAQRYAAERGEFRSHVRPHPSSHAASICPAVVNLIN